MQIAVKQCKGAMVYSGSKRPASVLLLQICTEENESVRARYGRSRLMLRLSGKGDRQEGDSKRGNINDL